ncbi:MAG TPA: efflux RND transporter periplasmic adaptor subunit [Chthoniobacterales bacterium]|nr:efflux RND transporter periplasmic adaptor subunit [Chthoniobacterales bacterium]
MKKICVVALSVAVLAAQNGCDWFREMQNPATPVQTIHPKRAEIVRRVTLPGNVMAYQEATLYAKVAGYLKTINVDKGDSVKEGDLLAEIEAPEMLADLVKEKAEAEAAQIDLKRVTEAQHKASDLVTPQTVDAAKAKAGVARAGLQRIETLLDYAKITAPFAGVITKRWADPGALIPVATSSSAAKSAAVVTLMDFSTVRIDVAIPDTDAPLVKKDLPVKVTVNELPGRMFAGTITRFAYALDESTKTMPTEIEIANPDLALRPGMWASVEIELQKKENTLLIPAEALVTEKNKNSVFVVRDNKALKVPIATGFDDGVNVEILKGCGPNDSVIIAGKQSVTDGQKVQATESK